MNVSKTINATDQSPPLTMSVTWISGVEQLDMLEIAEAHEAYAHGRTVRVQTTERRNEGHRRTVYEPVFATVEPDGFSLTYTDAGFWTDDAGNLVGADGDRGTATYQKNTKNDGGPPWKCVWVGGKTSPGNAEPKCKLSNEVQTRETRELKASVRDFRFRSLVFQNGKKCLITGEDFDAALDAAHIFEVRYGGNDEANNGIVLRADIHRLFDAHIIKLNPDGNFTIDPSETSYQEFFLKPKSVPAKYLPEYLDNINQRNLAKDKETSRTKK